MASKNKQNLQAAFFDALFDGNLALFHKCLESGKVDVNKRYSYGDGAALHIAAIGGSVEMVKALLDKGADIDAGNGHGTTALFLAAARRHMDVVTLLLERGCDVFKKQNGKTVRDRLASCHPCGKIIEAWEEKKILEEKNAKIEKIEQAYKALHDSNIQKLGRILGRRKYR